MNKVSFLIIIISLSISPLFAQNTSDEFKADTIVRLGGKKMIVDVKNITSKDIVYVYPGETEIQKVEIKQIEKLIYNDGKLEIFNKPIFSMVAETDWKSVWLTENSAEVDGLYKLEDIEAISAPSSRSKKAAKSSATIKLQKRAANKGGNVVLITHQENRGGYGELPGYYIKGIVYSFEPPKEEQKEADQ